MIILQIEFMPSATQILNPIPMCSRNARGPADHSGPYEVNDECNDKDNRKGCDDKHNRDSCEDDYNN